jgi:hypothetical protein
MQIDGGWSEWNEWSTCSALCDGGFRIRERKCNNPAPQNDGLECIGCHVEFEECNKQACNEVKKLTSWTNWLVSNNSESGQYFEKRYRYMCKAPISDPASLKISLYKEETRACNAGDPKCRRVNVTCEAAAVCDRKSFFCVIMMKGYLMIIFTQHHETAASSKRKPESATKSSSQND